MSLYRASIPRPGREYRISVLVQAKGPNGFWEARRIGYSYFRKAWSWMAPAHPNKVKVELLTHRDRKGVSR